MGYFDPETQRRTENIEQITILPVSEVQPRLHPRELNGLCDDIKKLIDKQRKRKTPNEALIKTLEKDLEKFQNNVQNPASDRYVALIYPENTTAQEDTCTPVLIAALFTTARTWKQPNSPSTEEGIKKVRYIYTMEQYSPTKRMN